MIVYIFFLYLLYKIHVGILIVTYTKGKKSSVSSSSSFVPYKPKNRTKIFINMTINQNL